MLAVGTCVNGRQIRGRSWVSSELDELLETSKECCKLDSEYAGPLVEIIILINKQII